MIDEILIDIKHRMDQAVSHTNLELNKLPDCRIKRMFTTQNQY